MRSLFKKSLAFCLVLALALSCFVGAITVNAETYNATISISAESLDSVPVTDTVVPVTLTINSDVAINIARLAVSLTGGLRFDANPVAGSEEYEITEISDDYSLFYVEAIDGEEDGNTVVGGYTNATVTLSVLVPAYTTAGTYAINVVTSGVNASTPNEENVNLVYDGSGAILVATDAEVPVIVVNNNPVVVNGSAQGISTVNSDLVDTNAPDNFSVAHGNKYVATYLGGLNATDDTMYDFYMNNSAEQIALNDPYAVNGLSFKLKVNGQLPKFGIYLDDSGSNWYEGEIKAYDAYGTLVATKEANEGWFFNGTLPEDFEGTIVIDNTNYRTENGKITFDQFYNEYGFTGVTLAAAIPHDAVDGDLLMEYDDLRLISDDLDTYVNSLVYCRHLNTTESEEITLAATCIAAGTKTVTVTCDDCGEVVSATENIEIPRTGAHKYSPDVCSVCGAINPEVPVIPVKGNPVIINGSVQGISERTSNAGTNSPSNFDVAYGEKYVVTYKGGIDASKDAMHDFFLYNGDQKMYIDDPSAVKGLSFKLKVNGQLPKFGMYLDDNGTCYYRGEIWAYDTTGTLVATKPDGDPFIFKNTLPEDFEGTIVIGVDNNKIVGGSGTFADHYAQHGGGFRGLKLAAAIPHDAVDGDFFMEYDDLRLIYDDLDTYTGSLRAEYEDTLNPIICDGSIMPSASKNGGGSPALDKEFTFTAGDEIVATYSDDKATAYGRHIIYFNNGRPIGEIENYQDIQGFSFEFRNPNPEAIQFRLSTDYNGYGAYGGTMCAIDHDGNIVATQERIGTSVVNMLLIPAYFDGIIVADATKPGWHSQNGNKMNDNFAGYYEDSAKQGGSYFATMGFEVTTKTDINIHRLGLTTFVYDDLRIIWQNIDEYIAGYANTQAAKAAKAEAAEREDTVKYYNTGAIVNETTFGESATTFADYIGKTEGFGTAPYYAAFDRPETVLGVGTAIKFTRSKLPLPEEDVALYINNKSTLDLEEIMNKDAAIFYAKIPTGQSVSLTRSFGEGFDIGTGTMAYDVVSKEITLFDGYSTDTLSGFEGYIIIPLADAFVGDYTFQEFIEGNEGFGGNYFTFSPDGLMNLTELWLGDFRLVDSGADFIEELGFEHMIGDVNGDKDYDVRDLVRLKKYNADYTVGIAYYNADIDQSGDVDSAAELVAARRELLTVIDVEGVYVAPEVGVGLFHSFYGEWDAKYNDLIAENDLLNTYITTDVHEIAEIKKNNGSAWIQLGKIDRNGNPIFADENGNPDTTVMKINPDYLAGLEATINTIQAAGVWDAVAGFTVEEILGATDYISADQFIYLTKYLRDTYHKRFFVCFSSYMVNGSDTLGIPAATPELYKYVTDMGYDMYYETEQKNREMFQALKDNTGNRTDVKYWFYPTAYSGIDADGNPTRTDAEAAAQIEMYANIFSEVPDSQKGGLLFYTWKTFTKSYGLDKLISDYNFELTAQALIDLATTYVK